MHVHSPLLKKPWRVLVLQDQGFPAAGSPPIWSPWCAFVWIANFSGTIWSNRHYMPVKGIMLNSHHNWNAKYMYGSCPMSIIQLCGSRIRSLPNNAGNLFPKKTLGKATAILQLSDVLWGELGYVPYLWDLMIKSLVGRVLTDLQTSTKWQLAGEKGLQRMFKICTIGENTPIRLIYWLLNRLNFSLCTINF